MFGHGARAAGRVFKTGAVGISTVFGVKNLVNDIQEGFAKQKHVKGTLKSVYAPFAAVGIYAASKALAKMGVKADSTNQTKVKIAKWFDEGLTGKLNISADNPMNRLYEQSGSKLYSRIGHDINSQSRARKNKIGGFADSKFGVIKGGMSTGGKGVLAVFQGLQDLMALTDAPVRLAEGEAALKEDGFIVKDNKWWNVETEEFVERLPEKSRIKASLAMAEASINFKRIGKKGQVWEAWTPFFNATIQSQYRQYMQLKSAAKVVKKIGKKEDQDEGELRQAKKLAIYYLALMAAEGLMFFLQGDDDESREEDLWLRETAWTWGKNGVTYFRWPKPRDAAILTNLTRLGLERSLGSEGVAEESPSVSGVLMRDLWSRVPVGGGLVRNTMEVGQDYNYFTQSPLTPFGKQREPAGLQTSDYTTRLSDYIGMATGKTIGLSPIQFQHLMDGATGGQYRTQTDRYDKLTDGNLKLKDMPFAKALVLEKIGGRTVKKFYTDFQDVQTAKGYEIAANPFNQLTNETIDEVAKAEFIYKTMYDIRKIDPRLGKKRSKDYEKYIVGLARRYKNYEPLKSFPDPLEATGMPKPMQRYIDERKQQIVYNAGEKLRPRKTYDDDQWYTATKNRRRSIVFLKEVAPTFAEARELLLAHRERKELSYTSTQKRIKEIETLYK